MQIIASYSVYTVAFVCMCACAFECARACGSSEGGRHATSSLGGSDRSAKTMFLSVERKVEMNRVGERRRERERESERGRREVEMERENEK